MAKSIHLPRRLKVDRQQEHPVEAILDAVYHYGKLHYWVRFTGYADPWRIRATDVHSPRLIKNFRRRYPHKPTKDLEPKQPKATQNRRRASSHNAHVPE